MIHQNGKITQRTLTFKTNMPLKPLKTKERLERVKKDAGLAYYFAKDVIKDRWPEVEPIIMQDAWWAWQYAVDVIEAPWPEAEHAISKKSIPAYNYAVLVIKDKWPPGEKAINKLAYSKKGYKHFVDNL